MTKGRSDQIQLLFPFITSMEDRQGIHYRLPSRVVTISEIQQRIVERLKQRGMQQCALNELQKESPCSPQEKLEKVVSLIKLGT